MVSGGLLYLYGGFRTFFPYPNSNAKGAGPGTASLAADGYVPYPSYPFYFNDMWQYNLSSGRWRQLLQADSAFQPVARRDHAMVIVGDVFFLHGGYASNFWYDDFWMYNVSTNAWLAKSEFVYAQWPASCTDDTRSGNESVWGQPTRGTVLDGAGGRVNYDVFIQQQRRQAPGWDGCRDRADRRRDLPRQLTYLRPSQRGGHRVLWAERFRLMMLYGGRGLTTEESPRLDTTYPVAVQGDLWQLGIDQCPKNCSLQGSCYYGFCFCYDGFYGLDCSNSARARTAAACADCAVGGVTPGHCARSLVPRRLFVLRPAEPRARREALLPRGVHARGQRDVPGGRKEGSVQSGPAR